MPSKKLIEGCIKIFHFLKLLYEDNADYQNVLEIFKDDCKDYNDDSPNGLQVVLNKYTNALKVFGIKVIKHKGKYRLMSSLYSMKLSLDDIKSLSILASFLDRIANKELSENLRSFLGQINLRMTNEDKNTLDILTQNRSYQFSFQFLNSKDQLEHCENLCEEKLITKITYLKNDKTYCSSFVPEELLYTSKSVYLKAYNVEKRQYKEIPLQNILLIEATPQRPKQTAIGQTVVFKLKNRLAQNYKYKEGEHLDSQLPDGSIIVINKNEDPDKLLKRLMRYSYNCEILSPQYLRYEFLDLVNETLSKYDE